MLFFIEYIMIDAHCHLNFKAFDKDYDAAIKRAFDAGVEIIINAGTSIESSQKAVELAQKYENLYAIVGIHPHHADKVTKNWDKEIDALAKMPKVVGIGEVGMDYYSYKSNGITDPKLQRQIFARQIEISIANKLPLQIHGRHAGKDILEIIKSYESELLQIPGMFHCFAGSFDYLEKVLAMGFSVGFDGNITYKGLAPGEDTALSDLVAKAPLERIITETDAPYLPPIPHRGSRNEPSYVIIVGNSIAKIKNTAFDVVNKTTSDNAKKVFKL
jgi:TatD DNase family protein